MSEKTPHDETKSVHVNSDPIEIARQHSDNRTKADPAPEQIGPYKVLSELGVGGMGIVYLAEQTKPIHRRVALKVIKLGMDTRQVIARFETEREALALMNHPNIATVYDAGVTEQGRPYFSMEYIRGTRITDYCDRQRLSTDERLRLFMDVCHAVQHAHQKGIIHRDIKPSNVMVTVQNDKPVPKVIDFGVAKATQHKLTEQTLFTQHGQMIGTPGYMSPEQAEMTTLDIDTRTDVYSLGVLLYELLVGVRPFDEKLLRGAAIGELQRIIREVDPPRPSTRLSALPSDSRSVDPDGNLAPARNESPVLAKKSIADVQPRGNSHENSSIEKIAHSRHTEPRTLVRQLRGDLDWIVMKSLEKDRTRRYHSANALAEEIQRHLHHQPVLAGPPSAAYRMRKFIRRNRAPFIAGCGIVAALLAGLITTLRQYARTEIARQEAVQGQRYALEMQHAAESRRAEAESITRFLIESFRAVDPSLARGRELTAKELLDQAAHKLTGAFSTQPLAEARLHSIVGSTYRALGAAASAESHLRTALTLRKKELGDENIQVAETLHDLGALMDDQGQYEAAKSFFDEALLVYRKNLGDRNARVLEMRNALGLLNARLGDFDRAEADFGEVLVELRKARSPTDPMISDTMCYLASVLREKGKFDQSELLEREALAMRRSHDGPEHPFVAESLFNLGLLALYKDDCKSAEEYFREALTLRQKLHGERHPVIALVLCNLGEAVSCQGNHTDAERLVRDAIEMQRTLGPSDHLNVGHCLCTLGAVLLAKGEAEDATTILAESLTILRSKLPAGHWSIANAECLLGYSLTQSDRTEEGEKLLLEGFARLKSARGVDDRFTQQALFRLIRFYEAANRPEQAGPYRSFVR